jgi:hypothetical protein
LLTILKSRAFFHVVERPQSAKPRSGTTGKRLSRYPEYSIVFERRLDRFSTQSMNIGRRGGDAELAAPAVF